MRHTTMIAGVFIVTVTFSDLAGAQIVLQRQYGRASKLLDE